MKQSDAECVQVNEENAEDGGEGAKEKEGEVEGKA